MRVALPGILIAAAFAGWQTSASADDGARPQTEVRLVAAAAMPAEPAEAPSLPVAADPLPMPMSGPVVSAVPAKYETLTVILGGDLGLNGSGQPLHADAALKHGQRFPYAAMTRGLVDHLKADVVFANLETVVTDRAQLAPVDKTFNFRTHPDAVKHLLGLGFNVFSTANNHAIDYGEAGMADTVRHLETLQSAGLKAAPGTGFGRTAALAPADVRLPQGRVRVSALGIGGGPAQVGPARATMASWNSVTDLHELGSRLRDADGDVRIMSVHFGQELAVRPSESDARRLREAVRRFNIDLVAGHHAHVAAGVQEVDGRVIFYGLGNLLHPGMQDMGRLGICRDFGVLTRVHFGRPEGGRYEVRAIEVWALADMHAAARVRTGDDGRTRIDVLNHHAAGLDDASARGIRFTPQTDGSGLYCTAAGGQTDDALAGRCQSLAIQAAALTPLPTPSAAIAQSCGSADVVAQRDALPARVRGDASSDRRRSTKVAMDASPTWLPPQGGTGH